MYNAVVHRLGLICVLVAACAPQRDPETLEQLKKIEQRLQDIERKLSAVSSQPSAPGAEQPTPSPAPQSAPMPAPAPASEPAAPEKPTKATLSGTIKLDGPYAVGAMPSVVALHPLEGHARPHRAGHYQMEQVKKQFAPRVLAVPVGSQVAFPNHDVFFHNVFSLSSANKFDLGVFNQNMSRDVTFDKSGVVQVLCNLHALMTAYIVVLDDPYFAVSDDGGHFSVRDVPPGRYKLRVWNERSRHGVEKDVDLVAGKTTMPFVLAADLAPSTPPDKNGKPRSAGY
jgi:plastocyanin